MKTAIKQCGTCKHGEIDYPPSPGDSEDGVNCSSREMMENLAEHGQEDLREEYARWGFINVWRLEELAEPEYECPYWEKK